MVLRQVTWAKKVPRKIRDGFKTGNLYQEGPEDRLEMALRQVTWAKKVPRIN